MLVLCLSSPMGAALEWWWMKTALTVPQIISAFITLLGVAVALAPGPKASILRGAASEQLPAPGIAREAIVAGTIFGVIAALCQALGAVLSRQAFGMEAAAGENIDGITAAYQRVLGGVLVTGIFLVAIRPDWLTNRKQMPLSADL